MKTDPAEVLQQVTVARPKMRGPGSGRESWIAFADAVAQGNEVLWDKVQAQSNVIAALQAEVDMLRARIASRKPKGGRPRTSDRTVAAIEADLAAGLTQRQAAVRNGVSAMTVSRLARGLTRRGASK